MRKPSTSVAQFSSGEPSPLFTHSHPASVQDDDSFHDGYGYTTHDEEEHWADEDEVSESEASVSYGGVPSAPRSHPARLPLRTQPVPYQQHYRPARRVPDPVPSVDHQDEFGAYGQQYATGQFGRGAYARPGPQHPHAYYYPGHQGQVVGYGANPFSPGSSASSPASYTYPDIRGAYSGSEMTFPQHYYQQPYGHQHQYQMGHPGMHLDAPGAPPAPPTAPVPSAREKELQDKIAEFEREKQKLEQAERQKEIEAEARRKAAEESRRIIEEMERLKEQNKIELERAREEAARAAREGIAAEAKAAEERAKQQAEAVKQAEERVKIMFEDQRRAEEARKKQEEEDRARAEEAAKLRLEAALRAVEEAKAAQAKKDAEEAEKLNGIREEAKRKADAEFAAKIQAEKDAAAKKAEEEALRKAEQEAWKKRIEEDTKISLEEKAKKERGPFLQFKDALGRKYNFPYRLCITWPNMEELIKQAFDGLDGLSYQVHEGWYDLLGPAGEIILPSVWERIVEPEWSITMSMWPLERIQKSGHVPPHVAAALARSMGGGMPPPPPGMARGRGGAPPGMAPPPGWPSGPKPTTHVPAGVHVVRDPGKKEKKKKKQIPTGFVGFFGGKPPPRKSSKK